MWYRKECSSLSVLMWYRTGFSSWSVLMWYSAGCSSWSELMWYRAGCSSLSVLMWYRAGFSRWSVLMWYRAGCSRWSVLMWYKAGCSSRTSGKGQSSITRWIFLTMRVTFRMCTSTLMFTRLFVVPLSSRLLVGCLFVCFLLAQFIHYSYSVCLTFIYAHIYRMSTAILVHALMAAIYFYDVERLSAPRTN
jgi:hypothetical protein